MSFSRFLKLLNDAERTEKQIQHDERAVHALVLDYATWRVSNRFVSENIDRAARECAAVEIVELLEWSKDLTGEITDQLFELRAASDPLAEVPVAARKIAEIPKDIAQAFKEHGVEVRREDGTFEEALDLHSMHGLTNLGSRKVLFWNDPTPVEVSARSVVKRAR